MFTTIPYVTGCESVCFIVGAMFIDEMIVLDGGPLVPVPSQGWIYVIPASPGVVAPVEAGGGGAAAVPTGTSSSTYATPWPHAPTPGRLAIPGRLQQRVVRHEGHHHGVTPMVTGTVSSSRRRIRIHTPGLCSFARESPQ